MVFPQIARLELDDLLGQLIERAQDVLDAQGRLRALLSATRAVSEDLSLPLVLTRIVESACQLIGAQYGAIGVVGTDGSLEEFIHTGMPAEQAARLGQLPTGHGILGLVIQEPQPLRLEELGSHPAAVGFPAEHPSMRTFLGVPIRVRNRVFGNIYLTEKSGGRTFTGDDEELLVALAGTAAIAIEHAQLYAQAQVRQRALTAAAELARVDAPDEPWPLLARHARRIAAADLCAVIARSPGGKWRVAAAEGHGAGVVRGMVVSDPAPGSVAAAMHSHGADVGMTLPATVSSTSGAEALIMCCRRSGGRAFSTAEADAVAVLAEHAATALAELDARRNAELLELLSQRDAIARDMNDQVVSQLFATGLALQSLTGRIGDPALRAQLFAETERLDEVIKTIRNRIFDVDTGAHLG
jgi:GAF domain-containing protein